MRMGTVDAACFEGSESRLTKRFLKGWFHPKQPLKHAICSCLAMLLGMTMTSEASAHLQCVPYARRISGIEIHGNAKTWSKQAEDHYQRGTIPKPGAVMALAATDAMPLGHVAVIDEVVDKRHVLIDHANWSAPGMIEHRVLAEDVSADGDWSLVRIFYAPIGGLGSRANPVSGFIYPDQAEPSPASPPLEFARADQTEAATFQGS